MSFNFNTAPAVQTNNAWEKSAGFLNLYLPGANGTRSKLGAINLKLSSREERKLFEACNKSPEDAERIVKNILSQLIIEFRSAEPKEGAGFDIYS